MASQDPFAPENMAQQSPPRGPSRGAIVLWLVAASWLILLIPLYIVSATVQRDVVRLETNIQTARQALTAVNTPEPEIQELVDEIAQVRSSADEIEQAYASAASGHVNWPAVMAAIGNYNPSQLNLTSITQADSRVTLNGRAIDDSAVIAYSRSLEESDLFSRVVVQSVSLIATPFATAATTTVESSATPLTSTGTITPTPSPTPTPDPADEYEVDDFEPRPIFLGQPQRHNFYPVYDVDRVTFLAKAGRYYRVATVDLAPGVDTFLTVILGTTTYTNDDREPGMLNSEITFQGRANQDTEVTVKVTNRGEYGADRVYQLVVEEIIPTPTPTATPSPTPTSTPSPSPTITPSPSLTPTPDLRDEYEPDDDNPKPIALGETQKHNFYPENDRDLVQFLAKSGRYYRVSTSDLAPGVDTYLTVSLDDAKYANDDREPGDLSSEIVFQITTRYDIYTLVEVTNRRQYGADRWYQITVEEIIPTPTPTPPPTETSSILSRSRLPGVASLRPALAFVGREGAPILPVHQGVLKASDALNAQAVEFVIVLELKTGSP